LHRGLVISLSLVALAVGLAPTGVSLAQTAQQRTSPCQGGWTSSLLPPNTKFTDMESVAALSKTDVWAVGQVGVRAVALHFDGTSWSQVSTPRGMGSLFGVAGVSSDDVWAVGAGPPDGVGVIHWDGAAWTSVPTPRPGPYGGEFFDVAVIASDDVWAAGFEYTAPAEEDKSITLTEHWDGTAWTIVPSPSLFPNSKFFDASADATSDVWAMGLGEIDRWDGRAWRVVTSAPPNSWTRFFLDVAAFGPKDVWVGGYSVAGDTQPAFIHWNGTGWKFSPSPTIHLWGQIFGVGGPSSDRLWAVGTDVDGLLMERWDGVSWQQVPIAHEGTSGNPRGRHGRRRRGGMGGGHQGRRPRLGPSHLPELSGWFSPWDAPSCPRRCP
jgi:hypothetical protein